MRILAFAIATLLIASPASAAWRVTCDTSLRPFYCYALAEAGGDWTLMIVVGSDFERRWHQPVMDVEIPNLPQPMPRISLAVDGGAPMLLDDDELSSLQIIQALRAARRATIFLDDEPRRVFDVTGFNDALEDLVAQARPLGFVADERPPLDPVARARWFARRQVDATLQVPGSAVFDFFEVFEDGAGHRDVCVRFSALNLMGVRGRAQPMVMRLRDLTPVRRGQTHRVVDTFSEQDGATVLANAWSDRCRDRPPRR